MYDLFIGGEWMKGEGAKREIINPATEELFTSLNEASAEQVKEAVQIASDTFQNTGWAENASFRVQVLHDIANAVEKVAEEIARMETENTGKPIRESRLDVQDAVHCFRYYAELVEKRKPWTKEMEDGTVSKIVEEPVGVCGLIVPWNFPLLLGVWKIAPALAAGNTVVFKPAEITPLSILKLTRIIAEAGLPQGVFNLVLGGAEVGQAMVQHPLVDKISFTGGVETGKKIYEQCAHHLKRISLELGGKSPLLVFDDVDVKDAVEWAIFGSFFNQGQVCVASSRILVHQNLYEQFIKQLLERLDKIKIGSPADEKTEMGPLISREHREAVEKYINIGLSEGAQLLTGGKRLEEGKGFFLTPAVFVDVQQNMRIVQEEIFGPVNTIQHFSDEEEAIHMANNTSYGLAAGILSNNLDRAERVSKRLKAGTIWINGYHTPYVDAPWGGYKQSGLGRELGPQGLAGFLEYKHINTSSQLPSLDWYYSSQD